MKSLSETTHFFHFLKRRVLICFWCRTCDTSSTWIMSREKEEIGKQQKSPGHRSTKVENPGRSLWNVFLKIMGRGSTMSKISRGCTFLCITAFLLTSYLKIFKGSCFIPPDLPPPPVSIYGPGSRSHSTDTRCRVGVGSFPKWRKIVFERRTDAVYRTTFTPSPPLPHIISL